MAVYITTVDNPWDPCTQFDNWFMFDMQMGYNTCGFLARMCADDPTMTDEEEAADIERAIDEILAIAPQGIYKKIVTDD